MNESSKGNKVSASLTSVTTERNRLISWDSPVHGLNKPDGVTPSAKSSITIRTLMFVRKMTELIFAFLPKLPYELLMLGYEIAKLVTRGFSSIRRLLSSSIGAR